VPDIRAAEAEGFTTRFDKPYSSSLQQKVYFCVLIETAASGRCLRAAALAATKEGERVAFDLKVCLIANSSELVNGEADIYVYDAVTLCAGQVMVMIVATNAIVMGSVGKLDTIQQAHTDELFHRTENRSPAQARLYLP
jgi:hypothetical protein